MRAYLEDDELVVDATHLWVPMKEEFKETSFEDDLLHEASPRLLQVHVQGVVDERQRLDQRHVMLAIEHNDQPLLTHAVPLHHSYGGESCVLCAVCKVEGEGEPGRSSRSRNRGEGRCRFPAREETTRTKFPTMLQKKRKKKGRQEKS